MVGALARFNIKSSKLLPEAKAIADIFGLKSPCYNPFMNNIAQLVEIVHSFVDSINIIDNLLSKHLTQEDINIKIISGNGIGAVEVPRGILFHEYLFDDNGICIKANCVIPTNQNHGNIQKDLEVFTPNVINLPDEELKRKLSMLVRAYDPCISCSTHLIDIKINKK
jgi:coenzyme F420-reducing hydrogenase alpha subunit